jgi:RNA polymerase I-specific transcription initiation factor RRN7
VGASADDRLIAEWNMSRPLAVLYDLAKTVAHVLSLPLALHHTLAPRLAHLKDDDPDSHKYDNVPPELALLVAVIIVLKMVYGLDGKLRYAREQCPNTGTKIAANQGA